MAKEYTLQDVANWFGRQARSLQRGDYSKALAKARDTLYQVTADCFQGAHFPDGTPFAPLKHRQGVPLIKSGHLMGTTLMAVQSAHIEDNTLKIDRGLAAYAGYQFGGTQVIPARDPLGFADNYLDKAEALMLESFFITLEM